SDEAVLLVPLKVASDLPPGPLELKAKVSWLECQTVCVLGSGNVSAQLNIGAESKPTPDAALFQKWQKLLPQPGNSISARAWWDKPPADSLRSFILQWNSPASVTDPDFFPDASDAFEVQADTEKLSAPAGQIRLLKAVKKYSGDWPAHVSGVVVEKSGDQRLAYNVDVKLGTSEAATSPSAPANAPLAVSLGPRSIWEALLLA